MHRSVPTTTAMRTEMAPATMPPMTPPESDVETPGGESGVGVPVGSLPAEAEAEGMIVDVTFPPL